MKLFKYLAFPIALLVGVILFEACLFWQQHKINQILIEEALKGNKYAVRILAKHENPYKIDKKLLFSAMYGNKYALEALNIESSENK